MPDVEIYTRSWCPYCHRAKRRLAAKGVSWAEYDLDAEPERQAEMVQRSAGRWTVPQIFIDGRHIGGSDDLAYLDAEGRLDELLADVS